MFDTEQKKFANNNIDCLIELDDMVKRHKDGIFDVIRKNLFGDILKEMGENDLFNSENIE